MHGKLLFALLVCAVLSLCVTEECKDQSGTSMCARYKRWGRCTKPYYTERMKTRCKKTCGFCGSQDGVECEDKSGGSMCRMYKSWGRCTKPYYTERMKTRCKKTCGFCGSQDGVECEDKSGGSMCRMYKSWGRCTNSLYRSQMTRNCRKTCGLCEGDPPIQVDQCKDLVTQCGIKTRSACAYRDCTIGVAADKIRCPLSSDYRRYKLGDILKKLTKACTTEILLGTI